MSYEEKKEALLKAFGTSEKISLGKSTTNLFRERSQNAKKIDVRHFNKVIKVDTKRRIAEVEGMTSYEDLVDATLKHNLIPTVIPELKSITIGGGISGVALEMTSYKYGFVHETIQEMEILLGNGKVITCSKTKNKDLFFGFPNTYGTLGYVLKAKVMLIPVKKYVKMERFFYKDTDKFMTDINRISLEQRKKNKYPFIEGTTFSRDDMVLTLGECVDKAPYTTDYTYMKIYYKSLHKKIDYMTIKDYIWRFDTDWFWCSKFYLAQIPIIRLLLGRKRLTSKWYHKVMVWSRKYNILGSLQKLTGRKTETIIQDVEVPIEHASNFLEFFHKEIGITPIVTTPIMPFNKDQFTFFPMKYGMHMNIGFYDFIKSKKPKGHLNRLIEKKIREYPCLKLLYSDSYYSEKEFWSIYDKKAYDKLKKKYDPTKRFLNLYEKCVLKK